MSILREIIPAAWFRPEVEPDYEPECDRGAARDGEIFLESADERTGGEESAAVITARALL
jgi:hypothetical protein